MSAYPNRLPPTPQPGWKDWLFALVQIVVFAVLLCLVSAKGIK